MTAIADPLDLYGLDAELDVEHAQIRDTVARFVDTEVLPVIGECFAEHRFSAQWVARLADLGLLGATLRGYGCAGADNLAYGLVCRELERGDSSLRSFVSVQSSLAMGAIHAFGSDAQKDRWLPAMARGESVGCFGLTESHGGSDPANMRTRARRDGGDWILDGSKVWITNGSIADVAVVWAAAGDDVGAFVLERGMPGFTARGIESKLSMRASDTAELFLDGVRVPDRNRLPGTAGLASAFECLNGARFGIVWGALGAAAACLEEALAHVASRSLFGRPLASTQLIQARLAEMARRLTGGQLLARRLTELKEQGRARTAQISLAKWNNVRLALDVARECRDILGAAGISVEHAAMRHMLNLESVATYEGTESVHQLVVGRALTGVSAF